MVFSEMSFILNNSFLIQYSRRLPVCFYDHHTPNISQCQLKMLTFSHPTKSYCENKDNLCNIAKTSERARVRSRSQRFVSAASAKTAHSLPPSSLSSGIATLDSVGDAEGCVSHRAKASPSGGSCRRSRLMRGMRVTSPHPSRFACDLPGVRMTAQGHPAPQAARN